jgi:hypothetical protein
MGFDAGLPQVVTAGDLELTARSPLTTRCAGGGDVPNVQYPGGYQAVLAYDASLG